MTVPGELSTLTDAARSRILSDFEEIHGFGWKKKKMPTKELLLEQESQSKVEKQLAKRKVEGKRAAAAVGAAPLLIVALHYNPVAVLRPIFFDMLLLCAMAIMQWTERVQSRKAEAKVSVALRISYPYEALITARDRLLELNAPVNAVAEVNLAIGEAEELARKAEERRAKGQSQRPQADELLTLAAEARALVALAEERERLFALPEPEEQEQEPRGMARALTELADDLTSARRALS